MAVLAIAGAAALAGGGIGAGLASAGMLAAGTTIASAALTGAEIGWMVGGAVGSMLFRQKGPSPADIRIQDSAYGKPIPQIYGMYRVAGNIIWTGQPYVSNAGKGGKGPQMEKVSMSFAVGLCKGAITGVRRIWANGKLIYDFSNPSNFQALSGSASMVTNFTVYPGDENQLPDPTMQAALGVNATPAYRGLAYVVFNDLDLSKWGNYLPSLSFEVVTNGTLAPRGFTSSAYTLSNGGSWYFTMMPYLTAQGGVALMTNGNSSAGVTLTNLSAYGANNQGILYKTNTGANVPGGWSLASSVAGNSDVPGAYFGNMWLYPDGTFDSLPNTPSVGFNGIEVIFGRSGDDFFLMSYWGGSGILYRCSIAAGGAVQAQTTIQINSFYGASADYVYAGYNGTVYQLNRKTMVVVQSWAPAGATADAIGYVVDDNNVYLNYGTSLYLFNPSTGISTKLGDFSFSPTSLAVINPNLIVAAAATGGGVGSGSATFGYLAVTTPTTQVTVADAVADICNKAGLTSAQYDVTQLTDTLIGYGVTNHSPARSNVAPLMQSYFFDACDVDGLIKFVRRGSAPVGTFYYSDLGASPNIGDTANQNPVTETIAQEVDLPRSIQFSYPELADDYNPNTQRAQRAYTNSNKDLVIQAPIVFAGSDALARTQAMLWAAWVGRKTFAFTTGLQYLMYEPGDVMTLQGPNGESYTIRITRCQYDGQGTLIWQASLEQPDIYPNASYTTAGAVAAGFKQQAIDYSGPTMLAVLDVPPLRDSDTSQGLYLAACGMASSWPGCLVELSRDGSTYANLVNIGTSAVMGVTNSVLPTFGGGNQPDELSTVSVIVYEGALASASYSDFLAGLNAAYIGGEIVFFRNATQTAANTYTLSGFLRARVGTEAAMAAHVNGEQFVLLNAATLANVALSVSDIGNKLYFEAFLMNLYGQNVSASTTDTPQNARVQPLAPHLLRAGKGSASSLSDISVSWIRRARIKTQWLDGADVALDESAETYTLTVYKGGVSIRTQTVNGPFVSPTLPSFVYTAAMISADGVNPGDVLTITVQQHSDAGVLGLAATTTITR